MNHKAETSVLNTIIGAVVGIAVAVITIAIFVSLFKVGNPERDSLHNLALKIKEVSGQTPGATGLAIHFQGEESFFYPITAETRNKEILYYNQLIAKDNLFSSSTLLSKGPATFLLEPTAQSPDCLTQDCLCLCREVEPGLIYRCLPRKLVCEPLPEISLSPGTGVMFKRTKETPAQQQIKIIKCRGNEAYCQNSRSGDISIIFNWLDQKGVYDPLKQSTPHKIGGS